MDSSASVPQRRGAPLPYPCPASRKWWKSPPARNPRARARLAGAIYDWGANYNGQAGIGTESAAVYEPTLVPLPGAASEVSCGGNLPPNGHTLALVKGVPYGWGADAAGQVGDGQTVNKLKPVIATAVESLGLTHVVASGAYSLGINAIGELYAWGSDEGAALGTGLGLSSLTPVAIESGVVEISGTALNSLDR